MTDTTLIPIGTSPAWYNPGEPSSGFVLEAKGFRVLIDCGSGVVSRYLELEGAEHPIDAIVLTHTHADHCFDLIPLKFGIEFGPLRAWRPQLWLPPGARERLTRLVSAWDSGFEFFDEAFDVREYEVDHAFSVGPFTASAMHVPHYIACCALRFEHAGTSCGYTADTGPCEALPGFMQGVDLLLAEAALAEDDAALAQDGRGHITASEAGAIAHEAGAHSLLLTHIPEELGFERARAAAATVFGGPVGLARSGERYDVASRLAVAR